jgi:hypothetical protein
VLKVCVGLADTSWVIMFMCCAWSVCFQFWSKCITSPHLRQWFHWPHCVAVDPVDHAGFTVPCFRCVVLIVAWLVCAGCSGSHMFGILMVGES